MVPDTASVVGLLVHWVCCCLVEPVLDVKIVHLGQLDGRMDKRLPPDNL